MKLFNCDFLNLVFVLILQIILVNATMRNDISRRLLPGFKRLGSKGFLKGKGCLTKKMTHNKPEPTQCEESETDKNVIECEERFLIKDQEMVGRVKPTLNDIYEKTMDIGNWLRTSPADPQDYINSVPGEFSLILQHSSLCAQETETDPVKV